MCTAPTMIMRSGGLNTWRKTLAVPGFDRRAAVVPQGVFGGIEHGLVGFEFAIMGIRIDQGLRPIVQACRQGNRILGRLVFEDTVENFGLHSTRSTKT